jgi:aspartyl-tRNA(Asn)/glutamyl-tRNA(Gln) amidotransferase subunit B
VAQYDLTPYTTDLLTAERSVADFFETAVASTSDASADKIANWLTGDFFSLINQAGIEIQQSKVTPNALAELVTMVERGEINATSGKSVLSEMFESGGTPQAMVKRGGLTQLNDPQVINALVSRVLHENPQQVEQYLGGKTTVSQWLFGQVMRAAGGRANPSLIRTSLNMALQDLEERRHTGE